MQSINMEKLTKDILLFSLISYVCKTQNNWINCCEEVWFLQMAKLY